MIYLTPEDIVNLNARHLGGTAAVRDAGLVASSAGRPSSGMFGTDAYPTMELKAAALLHSLICNHGFVDGNKRTAWSAMEIMLWINGRYFSALSEDEAFELVHLVATDSEMGVEKIAEALRIES
ncbi:type II toxin-antitoxin system death-on-curing family toxin [Nocardia sp. NPDC050175]|uniref:type II toxin-antitoxin system death-on-curing family toxin n=1 Tax=Nocardia sp. NPDC050175 TaxID=3364317 RepID=UPI0037B5A943